MLIEREASCLLVVDIQERLVPAIHEGERVVDETAWLMRVAGELGVPILLSEQYPKGLGPTVEPLRQLAAPGDIVEKVHFSCAEAPECRRRLDDLDRPQVVIAGIEAHVCVLQTALGLAAAGRIVHVVDGAVSSRRPRDKELGLERMRAGGVQVVSREMVAFEWLGRAGTDTFRRISKQYLR